MRVKNWETVLGQYLRASTSGRFRYGAHDCCRFAAGAVTAITGLDVMKGIRYSNRREARAELQRLGGIIEAVRHAMEGAGFRETNVLHAQRGDVVIADLPGPTVGIVGTDGWHAVFLAPQGVTRTALSACRFAWRIE